MVRHHTAPGIFCSSAIMDKGNVRMLDGTRMKFQCKESGHYIDNSKVVKSDLVAGNGVIHIINKIQLPPEGIIQMIYFNVKYRLQTLSFLC